MTSLYRIRALFSTKFPWITVIPRHLVNQAPLLSNQISLIHGSRIKWKSLSVNSFAPTVTKFCVMWESLSLPHDTKFRNCRDKIVDNRTFLSWPLIHGSSWSGLIKLGPEGIIWYGQGDLAKSHHSLSYKKRNWWNNDPKVYLWIFGIYITKTVMNESYEPLISCLIHCARINISDMLRAMHKRWTHVSWHILVNWWFKSHKGDPNITIVNKGCLNANAHRCS